MCKPFIKKVLLGKNRTEVKKAGKQGERNHARGQSQAVIGKWLYLLPARRLRSVRYSSELVLAQGLGAGPPSAAAVSPWLPWEDITPRRW